MATYRLRTLLVSFAAFSALALSATAAVELSKAGGATLLEKGKEQMKAGQTAEALITFELFKRESPSDARPYLYSGLTLLKAKRSKDAAIEFSQALERKPNNADDVVHLAEALNQMQMPGIAAQILTPLLSTGTLSRSGVWALANAYFLQRSFEQSAETLARYELDVGPDEEKLLLLKGRVFIHLGRLEDAMVCFEKAVQANSRSAAGFYGLAEVCHLGNNPEAAKKMALQAVKLDSGDETYVHLLGVTCKKLGHISESVAYLEKAARMAPKDYQIQFDLGDAYRKSGQAEKAKEVLTHYQQMLSERRTAQEIDQLTSQGEQALAKGSLAESMAAFERILKLSSHHWVANNRLAKIYLSQEKLEKALPHLEILLSEDKESSEANSLMAIYWFGKREPDQSLEFAEKALALRPGDAAVRNLRGNIYFARGQYKEAADEYLIASRLVPEEPGFRKNYEAALQKTTP